MHEGKSLETFINVKKFFFGLFLLLRCVFFSLPGYRCGKTKYMHAYNVKFESTLSNVRSFSIQRIESTYTQIQTRTERESEQRTDIRGHRRSGSFTCKGVNYSAESS